MTETLHIFEKAGLGKAPFKCLGVFENWYVTGGGSHRQPGGTCAYCGTGILYCYAIKSADGKRFVVGCECVRRTGDDGLIKGALNSPEQRKINRAKRKAKDDAVIAEWKALTESAEFVAYYQCLDTEDYGRGVLLDTELWQPKVMAEPTTIDQDGKDTDRIVDLVEEILGRAD